MYSKPNVKHNVSVFEKDVAGLQGYRYTSEMRLSTRLSNERMTLGIRDAASYDGKRVLDLGCGDGTFSFEIARMGAASVTGLDPATKAIDVANERAKEQGLEHVSFKVANIYDLGMEDGGYDVVVLRGVLHHLPDPAAAVTIATKLANEVVILEPNGANPALKLIERLSRYHIEHEEQSFLPKTIDGWLQAAGGEVQHRQLINLVPIFSPMPMAWVLKRVEPLLERIPGLRLISTGQYVVRATTGKH